MTTGGGVDRLDLVGSAVGRGILDREFVALQRKLSGLDDGALQHALREKFLDDVGTSRGPLEPLAHFLQYNVSMATSFICLEAHECDSVTSGELHETDQGALRGLVRQQFGVAFARVGEFLPVAAKPASIALRIAQVPQVEVVDAGSGDRFPERGLAETALAGDRGETNVNQDIDLLLDEAGQERVEIESFVSGSGDHC